VTQLPPNAPPGMPPLNPQGANPPGFQYSEDQRKHLDLIQGIVSRLAGNQFLFKGWVLTISSALLGYAVTYRQVAVALLGIPVTLGFAGLDAYFLRQERLFRHVWKDAVAHRIAVYDLNVGPHLDKVRYFRSRTDENGRRRPAVAFSPPIVVLYGMLVLAAIIVAGWSGFTRSNHDDLKPTPQPTQSSAGLHQPR